MDPTTIAATVQMLAEQLADEKLTALQVQNTFVWTTWAFGYGRKMFECITVLLAAFLVLLYLDARNARRAGATFGNVIADIRSGNMAMAIYYGSRYAATLIAMAMLWATR